MRVAVTGSSGFFAKYVIDELTSNGHRVTGIDIRQPQSPDRRIEFLQADCTVLTHMQRALQRCEAVIHLAGIPHPLERSADEVFHANAVGSFVTAWAAGELGIKRFILGSSESVLGNAFHPDAMKPDYFPIDERHPTLPLDPYGISKIASENAVERAAVRWGFSAATLRMPWIWGSDDSARKEFYRGLISEYPKWKKNMWAFVDARDAARAFRLALEANLPERNLEPYFIVANQHWVAPNRTTESLIDEFYQGVHLNNDPDTYASLITNVKAKNELKWFPEFKAKDVEL